MRQTISGLVAAIAVVAASAAPASACGLFESTCGQSYVAAPVYSGCNTGCGGGWAYERLPDPVHQYYYVNQGPTYDGPGNFAPYPTYQESAVSGWGAYHHPYYYGYHSHPHFRPWHAHTGYHGWGHPGMRYGYEGHHGYAPHYSMRYGYHGMPHHYGYREHTLRRYY